MREARYCRWCTHSSYDNFVKSDASAAGFLEAAKKVFDYFLASFILGSQEFVDAAI